MSGEQRDGPGRPPKVARLVDEYDVPDLGPELEHRWREEGESLRDLAAHANRRLVAAAVADTGLARFEGDAANLLRLLTADDASSGERIRVERRLERAGVDPDGLRDDLVSHQAVRTYLRNRPDLPYDAASASPSADRVVAQINRLQSRAVAVAEDKVRRLAAAGRLDVDDPRAIVGVEVACDTCGDQFELEELLDRGGCSCSA